MERRNYSQDVEQVGCPANLCSIIFIFSILAHMLYFLRSGLEMLSIQKDNVQYRYYLVGKQGTLQSQLAYFCWFLDQRHLLKDPTARNVL